jgi:hypothetical protein
MERAHTQFVVQGIDTSIPRRQTLLQGLEYQPNRSVKASLTAGIGSNQKYFAASFDAETEKLIFRTSYVMTGSSFQRISMASPLSSRSTRGMRSCCISRWILSASPPDTRIFWSQ